MYEYQDPRMFDDHRTVMGSEGCTGQFCAVGGRVYPGIFALGAEKPATTPAEPLIDAEPAL